MGKETTLAITLIFGSLLFLVGFYIMVDHVSFLAAIILMTGGVFIMCMSGKGFKEIDKRTHNGMRYIKD